MGQRLALSIFHEASRQPRHKGYTTRPQQTENEKANKMPGFATTSQNDPFALCGHGPKGEELGPDLAEAIVAQLAV